MIFSQELSTIMQGRVRSFSADGTLVRTSLFSDPGFTFANGDIVEALEGEGE